MCSFVIVKRRLTLGRAGPQVSIRYAMVFSVEEVYLVMNMCVLCRHLIGEGLISLDSRLDNGEYYLDQQSNVSGHHQCTRVL